MSTVFKNLVLEGNGMAGLTYIGVLKILEDKDMMKNFINFAGTSSGAIMVSLISIGYSSEEIYNIINDLDWNKMVQRRNWFYQLFHFWKKYGLFKYDNIENTIKSFFLNKLGKSDLTFREHYEITQKKLILVGVNITKKQNEYFSVDETPDMSVIKAIKISSSFPFIFDPIKHNDMLYIDGGIMNNFPIEYFGYNNTETLGINLIDDKTNNNDEKISNIFDYGFNIINSILLIQEHCDMNYKINTIYIKVPTGNIINNIVSMNQNIDELYNRGIEYTKEYFNNIDLKDSEQIDD